MADSYLRRFKKSHCIDRVISPDAFRCAPDEVGLSFHKREPPLDEDAELVRYQAAFAYPVSGHLLGLCEVPAHCFDGINHPRAKLPRVPQPYADLHCELTPCPNDLQAALLAACAIKLLDYVKKRD